MKKINIISLAAAMLIGTAAQALDFAWVKINNKTTDDLSVWWKGHHKRSDAANAKIIKAGQSITFVLHNKAAMNGPLYATKTEIKPNTKFYTLYSLPENAYFLPINKKGAVYRIIDLEPNIVGTGIRVRQSFPDFKIEFAGLELWKDPYINMEQEIKSTLETGRVHKQIIKPQ